MPDRTTVVVNGVVAILAITSLTKTIGAESSFLFVLQVRLSAEVSVLFHAITLTALFFLPIVLQLVAARLLWAQACDGVWPGSRWLSVLNGQQVPARASIVCVLGAATLCIAWPALYGMGTVWPAMWPLAYALSEVAIKAKLLLLKVN
ncbi:MAG: hypothetical protein NVSMB52_15730 [Chloroflexota bacterium]